MTVRKLLYWTAAEGAASRQAYDGLINVLLALQATDPARWAVTCTAYRPLQMTSPDGQPRPPDKALARDLYSVTFSSLPHSLFLVVRSQKVVLEGDGELQPLLEKLRLYQLRATMQLEGLQYRLGDFSVSIARAVQKPLEEFRGLILEVAYRPLGAWGPGAEAVLQDFCSVLQEEASSIGAALRVAAPGLEGFQLPEAFSPQHAAVQHVQLMAQLLGQ